MAKREQMVNVRLMFSADEHRKLKKKKGDLTWETAILKWAGIADE